MHNNSFCDQSNFVFLYINVKIYKEIFDFSVKKFV